MANNSLYNGKNPVECWDNLPAGMIGAHVNEYMANVMEVIELQNSGFNPDKVKQLQYRNFIIISYYNSL